MKGGIKNTSHDRDRVLLLSSGLYRRPRNFTAVMVRRAVGPRGLVLILSKRTYHRLGIPAFTCYGVRGKSPDPEGTR